MLSRRWHSRTDAREVALQAPLAADQAATKRLRAHTSILLPSLPLRLNDACVEALTLNATRFPCSRTAAGRTRSLVGVHRRPFWSMHLGTLFTTGLRWVHSHRTHPCLAHAACVYSFRYYLDTRRTVDSI